MLSNMKAKWRGQLWQRKVAKSDARSVAPHYSEHAPNIAFRDLPLSGTGGYATDWALFISAQLSTDAGSALQRAWVLIRVCKQQSVKARTRGVAKRDKVKFFNYEGNR